MLYYTQKKKSSCRFQVEPAEFCEEQSGSK